ncbi:MAG: 50S ribosomal protein L14 [Candidatus Diapherotrites archaeon]|nr:50S ribosomal protein L14 [Candidatus Diapherotrites archaeon]
MKGIAAKITKGLQIGSQLRCDDNTGAKELEIIGVKKYHGRRRKLPKAGVGDIIVCSVKKGKPEIRKKIVKAVIVRQKQPFRRRNGTWIKFDDNAAVLIDDTGLPKGSEIKGVVAKEVAERFAKIATIAKNVV